MTGTLIRILTVLLIAAGNLAAQEVLRPLNHNPAKGTANQVADKMKALQDEAPALLLPFREDFSYQGPFPDSKLWIDSMVFINTGFAIHPKTLGTATFDALNASGEVYPQATENTFQFEADFLTSQPLRLDSVFDPAPMALTPSDSILLTFYYQPQGTGSAPRIRDSLALEFLHTPGHFIPDPDNPDNEIWIEDLWVHIWSTTGQTLEEFAEANNGSYFKRVAVFIDDEIFLRPDFQFRFRNYASFPLQRTPSNYAGNTSIWNLDYILLDYGRSKTDSFYYDIAFAAPAQSILSSYRSMPWSHYIADPAKFLRNRFNVRITNLDNITYNYTYRYYIEDETGAIIRNYSGGGFPIAPFHIQGYQTYEPHANPIVVQKPLPTAPANAREFNIFHVIREGGSGDEWTRNDTISFRQVFDNYFAYDDGVPESGYGLVGNNARGAVRFILSHTDKLDAVQFFFNPTLNNQNRRNFQIKIWKNLDPPEVIYESDIISTEFESGLNEFVTYPLEQPIEVSDTIYVGWKQTTNDFLNIGFDTGHNAGEHIFYNTHGEWLTSIFQGALLIRPVLGQQFITDTQNNITKEPVRVFPNPATGEYIQLQGFTEDKENTRIQLMDASGRLLNEIRGEKQINISGLPNGLYFIKIITEQGYPSTSKFIISR